MRTGPETNPSPEEEPKTEELPLEQRQLRITRRQLSSLAEAIREHEIKLSDRPFKVRHADLHLYRRLRQISGGAG